MILIEERGKVLIGGTASLVEEDREFAWAEKFVVQQNPGLAWILGSFVEADNANNNGHIFDLDELKSYSMKTIPHTPVNMLHRPHYIVGNHVAAELMYPTAGSQAADGDEQIHPYVEALSAFYRYYFPDEYRTVKEAHAEGALFYSMEAVPSHVKCVGEGGCGQEFEYAGRLSDTYCAHLNEPRAHKLLKHPTFTGSGLIIPPVKPGWNRADVSQITALLEERALEVEMAYDQIAHEFPHLESRQWEVMMASLLRNGYAAVEGEQARDFSTEQRKALAKSGKALPDGSYPIETPEDLANAIQAFGRANPGDRAKVKAHIKRRAAALGKSNLIPDSWNS